MPKSQKQTGYLIKLETFIQADLADIKDFTDIQAMVEKSKQALGPAAVASITPTRR